MHVSENALLDFSAGLLTPSEAADVEAHVDVCPECREWVAASARGEDEGPEERAPAHPQRGSSVGRYIVIDPLGAGAMGVVFSAFDPVLDRKVALKFLHLHRQLADPAQARARLSREAQALARIAHPNVVAVHDVGTWEDQVFLAMEFVDGQELGVFLTQHPQDVNQTLALFCEAGRGLAAVHEAGLVHRDFKAANVLIDAQRRVRVTDLGLARAEVASGPVTVSGAVTLTQTGELLGTPAYMAPEQYRGALIDARTDQFAFCVALYEALYGHLPFGVRPVPELAQAVQAGAVLPPPANSTVPSWVRRVLLRGLSVEPDARFESMRALVQALSADPRRRRLKVAMFSGAALCVLALIAGTFIAASPERRYCRDLEAPLTTTWNAPVQQQLARAFAASLGERAWPSAQAVLDAYANEWVTARTDACRATRVRGEQSEAAMDLRVECLDRHLVSFGALINTLGHAEAGQLQRATDAARALEPLSSCSDGASLRLQAQPRVEDRAGVAMIETAVAESQALLNLGDSTAGLARTTGLVDPPYLPAAASVHLVRGQLLFQLRRYDEAEAQLRLAHQQALASNSVVLASQAVIALVSVLGNGLVRFEEAHQLAQVARAMLAGRGAEELATAEVLQADAAVFRRASDFKRAFALSDEATQLLEKHLGPNHPRLGSAVTERANVLLSMGNYVEAEKGHRRALELYLAEYGPEHPRVASAWSNLCLTHFRQRRSKDALAACTRALEIYDHLAPDFPDSGQTLTHLGSVQAQLRDFEGSIISFTRAIAVLEKGLGVEHPMVATPLNNRANQYDRLNRKAEAEADYLRSLAIREKALGRNHADVGESLFNLAELRRGQGRCSEALEMFERTLAIDEQRLGPEHPFLAGDLSGLAHCRLLTGHASEAVPLFERALLIAQKGADEEELGKVGAGLARALWATGAKEQARKIAHQARVDLTTCAAECTEVLAELNAWERKM